MTGRRERKVVTVLFADLAGFTSRAEAMDPEDVAALLDPYQARLKSELERFGAGERSLRTPLPDTRNGPSLCTSGVALGDVQERAVCRTSSRPLCALRAFGHVRAREKARRVAAEA